MTVIKVFYGVDFVGLGVWSRRFGFRFWCIGSLEIDRVGFLGS